MPLQIRRIASPDYESWLELWTGYNAFYGREGPTALDPVITSQTWEHLQEDESSLIGLVVESEGRAIAFAHCVIHPSTSRLQNVCYLQDLFVEPKFRGNRIGRSLIEHAAQVAREKGCCRLYWQTQASNTPARALYDQVAEHRGFIVYTREL
jgi:GNAT superfamily N-acetyltransferase